MGKKACEDKIIEECNFLIDALKNFRGKKLYLYTLPLLNIKKSSVLVFVSLVKGEPFDMTKSVSYAVSNIICSIVYGSRFEYSDPQFTSMLIHMNKRLQLMGSRSIQVNLPAQDFNHLLNKNSIILNACVCV